jgi:hypothetical protein
MRFSSFCVVILVLVVGLAALTAPRATTMLQMNLDELCRRADRVFLGTVIRTEIGTVRAGGGAIPTVTYTLRVDQGFKGEFQLVKGQRMATFTTIGKSRPVRSGDAERLPPVPGMPALVTGEAYLLLTTPPSSLNLSSPVGLGQGCFHITTKEGEATAENGYRNVGLFRGMDVASPPDEGPLPLSQLTAAVRAVLADPGGGTP